MFTKLKTKIASLVVVITGLAILVLALFRGFIHVPTGEVSINIQESLEVSKAKTSQGLPVRIQIPKINIDTKIEQVGITYKGNMSTPKIISETGWYKYGTPPGSLGSAVIDGHVDNGFNLHGVFYNLKDLKVGDDVYVKTNKDFDLHFVVEKIAVYPYKEVPLEELFNKKDTARLNLITCQGEWIPEEETDTDRLIVYTKLVD
jgi:sortase A